MKAHQETFAVDAVETDVQVARKAALRVAVQVDALNAGAELRQKPVAEALDAFTFLGHLFVRDAGRRAQSDDAHQQRDGDKNDQDRHAGT